MLGDIFSLPSLDGLITGDAEAVGVRYIPPTLSHPPLRLFYPAKQQQQPSDDDDDKPCCVKWFQDPPFASDFLCGYLHVIGIKHGTFAFCILSRFIKLMTYFLPLSYRRLPDCYSDLSPTIEGEQKQLPVIIFSHGLTGTGQENSLLCAAWARQGYMVVAVHHTDGSSACVPKPKPNSNGGDEMLWYQHGPSFQNYDPTFRPQQVLQRAKQLYQAVDFLKEHYSDTCRTEKVVAAGFSYGAATAALAAVLQDDDNTPFTAGLILLDGWFYIDVMESAGIEFEFPALVFGERGLSKIRDNIPTCVITSAKFGAHPKLAEATAKLGIPQIIPGTQHNNFCEICFWFPTYLLRGAGLIGSSGPVDIGAVGPGNPKEVYQDIIRRTNQFLKEKVTF